MTLELSCQQEPNHLSTKDESLRVPGFQSEEYDSRE